MLHGDVSDIGAPDLVGPRDRRAPEQMGINPGPEVRGAW